MALDGFISLSWLRIAKIFNKNIANKKGGWMWLLDVIGYHDAINHRVSWCFPSPSKICRVNILLGIGNDQKRKPWNNGLLELLWHDCILCIWLRICTMGYPEPQVSVIPCQCIVMKWRYGDIHELMVAVQPWNGLWLGYSMSFCQLVPGTWQYPRKTESEIPTNFEHMNLDIT